MRTTQVLSIVNNNKFSISLLISRIEKESAASKSTIKPEFSGIAHIRPSRGIVVEIRRLVLGQVERLKKLSQNSVFTTVVSPLLIQPNIEITPEPEPPPEPPPTTPNILIGSDGTTFYCSDGTTLELNQ